MGYYTQYTLTAEKVSKDKDGKTYLEDIDTELESQIAKELAEKLNLDEDEINDVEEFYDLFGDSIKWYDFDEDMIELSEDYPSILFTLDGIGEDRYDEWQAVYHRGISDRARIKIMPPHIDSKKFLAWNGFLEN